jgi:hypothetical protein
VFHAVGLPLTSMRQTCVKKDLVPCQLLLHLLKWDWWAEGVALARYLVVMKRTTSQYALAARVLKHCPWSGPATYSDSRHSRGLSEGRTRRLPAGVSGELQDSQVPAQTA